MVLIVMLMQKTGSDDYCAFVRKLATQFKKELKSLGKRLPGELTEEDAARIEKMVRKEAPEAEVTIINGGQPVYYFIISAEG